MNTITETEKFQNWIATEKGKGLIGLDFFVRDVSGATVESFAKEVNEMNEAADIEDKEMF